MRYHRIYDWSSLYSYFRFLSVSCMYLDTQRRYWSLSCIYIRFVGVMPSDISARGSYSFSFNIQKTAFTRTARRDTMRRGGHPRQSDTRATRYAPGILCARRVMFRLGFSLRAGLIYRLVINAKPTRRVLERARARGNLPRNKAFPYCD